MAKAILELEMPGSCAECPCKGTDVWGMVRCRLIHMKSDKYSGMAEGYAVCGCLAAKEAAEKALGVGE